MTPDRHRLVMGGNYYRADLDLVVETSDGILAAYCIAWLDPANRVVEFEPVGTRPADRRRGLARAVLLEGLRRAHGLGAATAIVTCEEGNPASCGLYESLGFRAGLRSPEYVRSPRAASLSA